MNLRILITLHVMLNMENDQSALINFKEIYLPWILRNKYDSKNVYLGKNITRHMATYQT